MNVRDRLKGRMLSRVKDMKKTFVYINSERQVTDQYQEGNSGSLDGNHDRLYIPK